MSGPIVRTGTTPKFWENWDNVFGKKSSGKGKTTAKKTAEKKKGAAKGKKK